MRLTGITVLVFSLAIALTVPISAWSDDKSPLDAPREHLQKGRYEEALEAYQKLAGSKLAKEDAVRIALGQSRAHEAIGQWDAAASVIEGTLKASPDDAQLYARQAELHFLRGEFDAAEKGVGEALKRNSNEPLAHLVQAKLFAETGRIKEANDGYRWFIRYYNQAQPEDAETLLLVARGAVTYARWNRNTQIYSFAVNTLCPDALKNDAASWQSLVISGELLLEKYNRAQGIPEIEKALAINPRAAEAHVALGRAALDQQELSQADDKATEALGINPQLPSALLLKADVRLLQGKISEARGFVEKARAINPRDQQTLARLAACDLADDGTPQGAELDKLFEQFSKSKPQIETPTRFSALLTDLMAWNAHPGSFFSDLGSLVEIRRQFDAAEAMYKQAIELMPQLPEPQTALGLLYMRVGKTDEAARILDQAFAADPYHVRVSNMRKVIRLLQGYEVISTGHFVLRVDSKLDATLGRYMSEYLEEIYPELVARFGYEPPQRTQFEVFNKSGGQTGHEWFSARMVGLPWIQTIGASTGMMVALASPTGAPEPFNWARVVKHEFVHVLTLQQTHFNIPHWFTEALAVTAEGTQRPPLWNKLLLERVPKGNIRNVDNLDAGFQRPESPNDWQFAYCQSRLYAQYITQRFGQESIRKMLDAYRDNLPTAKVIQQTLGVNPEDFEKGYREFLDKLVVELKKGEFEPRQSLEKLEQAYNEAGGKENPKLMGEYADALLEANRVGPARRVAEEALAKNSAEPRAALVVAKLEAKAGDYARAAEVLAPALNRDAPLREVLLVLAQLKVLGGKYAEAAELCELGRRHFPHEAEFLRGLAATTQELKDQPRMITALKALADLDPDDAVSNKKLAQLALDAKNWQEAVDHGRAALFVDVLDADVHRMLGEAWMGLENHARAMREYDTALELKPGDNDLELAGARVYLASGEKAEARKRLENILKRDKDHAEAAKLLKSLD